MDDVAGKKAALQEVLDNVAQLQAMLAATQAKGKKLEDDAATATAQLGRAEQLLGGLGGEKVRWAASKERLGNEMVYLVGNMMLAAGALAYLGTYEYEHEGRKEGTNQRTNERTNERTN